MGRRLDWQKLEDERKAKLQGTDSIRFEKTSPSRAPSEEESLSDLCGKNPILAKMYRQMQEGTLTIDGKKVAFDYGQKRK